MKNNLLTSGDVVGAVMLTQQAADEAVSPDEQQARQLPRYRLGFVRLGEFELTGAR